MNEHYDPNNPPHMLWRPQVPSPYVTHQDLAPMHTKIGSLEKGQETFLTALSGYRAETLTRMDRIEALIKETQRGGEKQDKGTIALDRTGLSILAISLLMVGAAIGRPLLSFIGLN